MRSTENTVSIIEFPSLNRHVQRQLFRLVQPFSSCFWTNLKLTETIVAVVTTGEIWFIETKEEMETKNIYSFDTKT